MGFFHLLPAVIALLQREGRVTYCALQYEFGFDDGFLEVLKKELIFKRIAIDEHGEGLVWTGGGQFPGQLLATLPSRYAIQDAAPIVSSPMPPTSSPDTGTPDLELSVLKREPRAPEAERRQLTVLFCDLVDSTRLSGQLDPEELREVIRAYQQTSAAVIQRFEGYIAQYLGDGLLVYFGWPRAHENDAQRAVHAGLGIIEAMGTLNTRLKAEKGVRLAVRIGLHTGPVVVGEMGGGNRHEHLALGETPNLAARFQALAAPDTVAISTATARLVQGAFALEDLGVHSLKGVAEPMPVFRVIGPVEMHGLAEEVTPSKAPFLVGRDEEVGLLLRRWEQSKEGLGQVVLISGEAGIGKSALVETMRAHVRAEGLPRIAFRCSPYHTNSVLYPVITHIERLLHFGRDDPSEAKLDKLERVLKRYALPLAEVVPLFAALLSVPLSEERYPALTLTPQQRKQQTLDTLIAWLVEEAERQPVLVTWEDLHWADPSTLEMLGLVLEQTPTVPMLSVLTFRPEFSPPWSPRSHMTPITLNRLERLQVEALITHLASGKTLPAEVVRHIVTKTDGVPLFVEELTKMLLESGILREEGDHYTLAGPLASLTIPATLQDSLMARLDQFNHAKEVAQLGAALGREFAYEMLHAISSLDEPTLQAGLAQLVAAEWLYQRGRLPRAKYIFKHALIQDAAYASLLKSTRQQYHRRIAQVLETQFPETVETQPELLAHHYAEAGVVESAIPYWQQAGQRAHGRSAHVEAIGHLTKGLEVLKGLPDTLTRAQQELLLQLTLGLALIATKGQAAPEVGRTYNRARELCQQVEDVSQLFRVLWGLWHFHVVRAELQTVRELSEELLTLAQRIQDPTYLLGAHWELGGALFLLGEFAPARKHWEQSFALYDPQQHHAHASLFGFDLGVFSLCWVPHALWHLGYPDQALAMGRKALALAQKLSHPFSLAVALDYVAMLHQFRREPRAVLKRTEAAVALCAKQGFAYYLAWGTTMQGWARVAQGQDEEGMVQIRQGLAALRATGAALRLPYYLALLAEACGQTGQAEEGLTLLAEALAQVHKTGETWTEAELYRLKGELLLSLSADNHTEAEACFHQALGMARHRHAKSLELRAALSLSRLWQQQSKHNEAQKVLADIYHWFSEGLDTPDLQEARALLEELG
jgi:class 3 adenylate cyclase/predicted ATPase